MAASFSLGGAIGNRVFYDMGVRQLPTSLRHSALLMWAAALAETGHSCRAKRPVVFAR